MPSRFAFFAEASELESRYQTAPVKVKLYPYYNMKPTNRATGMIRDEDGYQIVRLRWGFVKGQKFFKARSDNVRDSRLFGKAFRERRCLILINGFFEWNKEDSQRIPNYFKMKDDQLFALAAVYNTHFDEDDGENKYQFAVITVESNEVVGSIFYRMPAIIPMEKIDAWMNLETDLDEVHAMLKPYPGVEMESYEVNSLPARGDNGPETIKPKLKESALDDFF